MLIVLSIILAGVVLLVLAYPIATRARGLVIASPAASSAEEDLEELVAQRNAAFQAIRDLQFDHDVGKIGDEDLAIFEASLKQNAAESLRRLDAWEARIDGELGSQVERQIAARRERLARGTRSCPTCAALISVDNQYCTACGTRLEPAPRPAAINAATGTCPSCGRPVAPDDRFCPRCGQALAQVGTSRVRGAA